MERPVELRGWRGDDVVWCVWRCAGRAERRAVAAGADQELVGINAELNEHRTFLGTYFFVNLSGLILLDTRVIRGPVWESFVSSSSLGFYLLYSIVRWVVWCGGGGGRTL
jgi:hypothetical protein